VVFRKMLRAFGVGGPSVETVLVTADCRPGGVLEGNIQVAGGEHSVDVEYLAIGLMTRVEVGSGDNEYGTEQEFHRQRLTGSFRLDPGRHYDVDFHFDVPWETPITEVYGQHLRGMTMGLSTELEVARAVDKSDLDIVAVHPLPAQELILDGLLRLGFRFHRADVERGRVYGVQQRLPFYQEIEFFPPAAYAGVINQLELTFLPTPERLQVVLELDKRGGVFNEYTEGHEAFGRFEVDYAGAEQVDWAARLDGWLRQAGRRRGLL
jgi:sporulation-control protein